MFARSSKIRIGHRRPSFTLVELLVVIAIIAIMAGMVMFTLASAQQDALRTRTRGTIDKINQVILERWEGYRYRSVKLPITSEMLQRKQVTPRGVAKLRSLFLKDMMRMELPDNYVDLAYTPTELTLTGPPDLYLGVPPMTFKSSPGREYNVLRNYFKVGRPIVESDPAATLVEYTTQVWTTRYQASECLYAIVAHSTSGGGSALEGFVASEIGDVNGNGFPEFIDAWGEPIGWIRWPAGYGSALNVGYKKSSPDAFDPLRTAFQWNDDSFIQKPWTVVPLIISSGADKQFGFSNYPTNIFATSRNVFIPTTDAPVVGAISNAGEATDNVSNHDILLE
ncbi:MAG: type II secretion system protein [Pirellulaceae bacterium]|nr:type II secretion system protein [Pirellulaceae bacterium]